MRKFIVFVDRSLSIGFLQLYLLWVVGSAVELVIGRFSLGLDALFDLRFQFLVQ